jgi:tetratricopeptide (TPR) repeat protein
VDGADRYRVTHPEAYRGRNLVFPAKKPPGTIRIFCVGGSASAGWPHPPGESYGDYLQHALAATYPGKRIELLNVSAHAFASYRVRLIFDDVIDFDPDLVVVYTGNNEFLERRSYLGESTMVRVAQRSRLLYMLTRRLRSALSPDNTLSGRGRAHANHDIWMRIEARAQALRTDPDQFARLQEHFAFSIEHMVREASERGVPVVLLTVPVNLRDWQPNVSANPLQGNERERWQESFDLGRRSLLWGDSADARRSFRQALERLPEHAHTHYFIAKAFEQERSNERALEHYRLAKDLDANPFRAHSAFNASVVALSRRHDDAYLADADAAFLDGAQHAAPGFDLFLDYVHPTRAGNVLIARSVFAVIIEHDLLGAGSGAAAFVERAPPVLPDGRAYDVAQDMQVQTTLVNLFAMMHQYEAIVASATRSLGLLQRREAVLRSGLAKQRRSVREYMETFRSIFSRYLEMERRKLRGQPFDAGYEEELSEVYRRTLFPLIYEERARSAG